MQRNDWWLRVEDVLNAVAEIQVFTADMSFVQFQADARTVRAVEFNFVMIGEATRSIPADLQVRYPLVPWSRMAAMRNLIAHQYWRVALPIVWDTLQNDLPPLVPPLQEILVREP